MSDSKKITSWLPVEIKNQWMQAQEDSDLCKMVEVIDKKDWLGIKKAMYARFYVMQMEKAEKEKKPMTYTFDNLRSWRRSSAFKQIEKTIRKEYEEKFTMTGLMIVMSGTMVLFFLRALLAGIYLINFSVDGIVGVIGLVILVTNLQVKYRMIHSCTKSRDFLYMDVSSFLLSFLLKLMLPPNLDFTLVVLLVAYFVEKNKFSKILYSIPNEGR